MRNINFPIVFTTAILLGYAFLSQLYPGSLIVVIFFMMSPFFIVWSVYRLIKDGVPTKTSNQYTYKDSNLRLVRIRETMKELDYFNQHNTAA
jgi:hypothetical protein